MTPATNTLSSQGRLLSIDVFRALTMFLMIFVNDLWTLQGIPEWLEHADAKADGMGLADVVFPAFLFIVGLSIPLGIQHRVKAGDNQTELFKHVLLRTIALLVMGVFHVNLESYSHAALLPRPIWQILITIAFFLIWLDYKNTTTRKKYVLQGVGIIMLLVLALIYKGGPEDAPHGMGLHWWGILGLIGWTYFIAGMLYVIFRERLAVHVALFIFFIAFSSAAHLHWLNGLSGVRHYIWINSDGSLPALAMAGIITTLTYQMTSQRPESSWWIASCSIAVGLLAFGFISRPLWGISKIGATPSWVAICAGLSVIVFAVLTWLVDMKKKGDLFNIIRPAGTSTLTAYLLPYIHYALYTLVGFTLPLFLRTGFIGIVKCILYALVIILITGFLEKKKIRLKL